ncbi:MAG: RecQ family ATP-dependent DNA helicase [Bacteroidales bacterium]|nr:RecQ family ATP-dependent DNA helicase [Candidatus Physcocola equi]
MDKIHEILKNVWGHDEFRPLQEDIIRHVLSGKDALGLMPTGGGKSITFQVPALAKDGICIVVTPLIALMKDQVENLRNRGILAEAIYTGLSKRDIDRILDNCVLGDYKFLYVSPERLGTDTFIRKYNQMNVSMIAVDESHCISQWGYDFRPSYLCISDLRVLKPNVPILALTATATPDVVIDIQEKLQFRESKKVFRKSFARENLAYVVKYTDDKLSMLKKILDNVPGSSVVYVRNRKRTKEISDFLMEAGISSDYYHAGLSDEQKNMKQSAWKQNICRVIVATNAFGMGIDKPDVRTVVHMDLPDSLEAYFQEAGRAGRDGKKAYATLLYSNADKEKLRKRGADNYPDKEFIAGIYTSLCYFFQIAVGEGMGLTYVFRIGEFCQRYSTSILQTDSAIKLLQQAGYLEYNEDPESASKIVFSVNRDELYHIETTPQEDEVMRAIMRKYTGIFSDFVYIKEEAIASATGLSRDEIYKTLVVLRQKGVLNYIPFKKEPKITFTRNRVDDRYFSIPKNVYEVRKEQYHKKSSEVLRYATNRSFCRSQMLLNYFGETTSRPCGQCDTCIEKRKNGGIQQFAQIRAQIIEQIKECGVLKASDITSQQPSDTVEQQKTVLQWLLDEGTISIDLNGNYTLVDNM